MKKLTLLFVILLLAVSVLILSACDTKGDNYPTGNSTSENTSSENTSTSIDTTPTNTETSVHEHQWIEATCITPKTCQSCNKTDGEALGHSWKPATCQNPKTCSKCSTTEGSSLSEHSYQNGKCIYCNQNDPKEEEYEAANNAYNSLIESHELCIDVMDSIYGAWYFAIYEADDYLDTQACFEDFCSQTNLDYSEALNGLNTVLQSLGYSNPTGIQQLAALRTFSIAVDVVVQVYIDNGTYDAIESNLSGAKSSLKSVTNNYSDYTGYSTLKEYYSEISSYLEFCKSPTGSFSQLKNTIDTYETNLRKYKNDLGFIFE